MNPSQETVRFVIEFITPHMFSLASLEDRNLPSYLDYNQMMATLELESPLFTKKFQHNILIFLYHVIIGRCGHESIEET